MDCFNVVEAREIFCIEGKDATNAVDAHSSNESCIMHLDSGDAIVHQQPSPFVMDREAIGKQIEPGFHFSCSNIRLFWR